MNESPWRTRCVVEVQAELSDEPFAIGDNWVCSRPKFRGEQWPSYMKVVDVFLRGLVTDSVEEAHIAGINLVNIFLDRLSVVTYFRCSLIKIISTCPASVSPGGEFHIATGDLQRGVDCQKVLPEHIAAFEKLSADSVVHEAAHHARKALSENAAEQHLLHLHIAAERIALSETDEKIKYTCPSCEHKWDGPPASRRAVRALLEKRAVSRKDCDDATEYRSRVAHGGGKRDLAFYERVTELAGAVEGAVLSVIAERSGIKILQRCNIVIGMPITISRANRNNDGSFIIIGSLGKHVKWKAPVRLIELGEDVSESGGGITWGFPTDKNLNTKIDPIGWPE